MKKIKIMMLSLALFAVVGGALAFKAKFSESYCSKQAQPDGQGGFFCPTQPVCADLVGTTIFNPAEEEEIFTCLTEKPQDRNCNQITTCTNYLSYTLND